MARIEIFYRLMATFIVSMRCVLFPHPSMDTIESFYWRWLPIRLNSYERDAAGFSVPNRKGS
jgi:hypothetical protein